MYRILQCLLGSTEVSHKHSITKIACQSQQRRRLLHMKCLGRKVNMFFS